METDAKKNLYNAENYRPDPTTIEMLEKLGLEKIFEK